jgi:hypothetical protein
LYRRPGQGRITTPRKETDTCRIMSGTHEGMVPKTHLVNSFANIIQWHNKPDGVVCRVHHRYTNYCQCPKHRSKRRCKYIYMLCGIHSPSPTPSAPWSLLPPRPSPTGWLTLAPPITPPCTQVASPLPAPFGFPSSLHYCW